LESNQYVKNTNVKFLFHFLTFTLEKDQILTLIDKPNPTTTTTTTATATATIDTTLQTPTASSVVTSQQSQNEFIHPDHVKQWLISCSKIFIDTPCEQPSYRCYDKIICYACASTCTFQSKMSW
jgi:hypothetical protein